MPYRVILTETKRKIVTPGPLTHEEAKALAKYHNDNQLLDSWKYSAEYYEESGSKKIKV